MVTGERSLDVKEMAELLADARLALEAAQADEKMKHAAYDAIEAALFDALENMGLQSIRTERGLFLLNDLAWAHVEDEEQARLWAEREMPELIRLNHQRLSMLVRERVKEAGELPPGVSYTTSRKITWRKP